MFSKKIDFLAVGDITTDAFIKLTDANVHCRVNKENCELCLKFADKVPFESVDVIKAVGNSANASVSASRLGLSSALVANIGNDQNGKECLDELKKNRVNTKYISIEKNAPTNYHYVLWYDSERTILVKHHHFNYKFPIEGLGKNKGPSWLYLSSLAENSLPFHLEIAEWLKNHPETKLAFQPGTFQMKLGKEKLSDLYKLSHVFFCNVEESKRILHTQDEQDITTLLKQMHSLGPKIIVITDGPKGAYAYDGEKIWFMPPYPDPKPPFERTGAGDAFASTFTCALALGKTVEEALMWGPINSMSVVQQVGAQRGLLRREELEKYLQNAPETYKPRLVQEK